LAQAQARRSLAVSGAFVLAAVATAVIDTGQGRWLPIHLFLAGALVGAIGGATTLFTVTWSAAPAPSSRLMWVQRGFAATGAVGVVAARSLDWPDAVLLGAALIFVTARVVLAVVLVVTVRRGVKRRFDVAVGWYLAALVAGITAAVLGGRFATVGGVVGLRDAHVVLNLLGLVGLIIGGTLPTFIATVGRTKMSSRSTDAVLRTLLVVKVVAVGASAFGLWAGREDVAAAGLALYAAGVVVLATRLPAPSKRSIEWAGPRLLALWCGMAWWAVAVASAAIAVDRHDAPFAHRWTSIIVVVAYGQILWGSLAYLLPVLRGGGHERLGRGFAALRSWVGLFAVNVAGVAWWLDVSAVASVAVAVWLADAAVRAVRFSGSGR